MTPGRAFFCFHNYLFFEKGVFWLFKTEFFLTTIKSTFCKNDIDLVPAADLPAGRQTWFRLCFSQTGANLPLLAPGCKKNVLHYRYCITFMCPRVPGVKLKSMDVKIVSVRLTPAEQERIAILAPGLSLGMALKSLAGISGSATIASPSCAGVSIDFSLKAGVWEFRRFLRNGRTFVFRENSSEYRALQHEVQKKLETLNALNHVR